jgi:5-keto-L-gluconate epimerase
LKLSACSACYGSEDLFRVVDRLAELAFDGIELTVMYHVIPQSTSPTRRMEIRRYIHQKGLEISALHFIFPRGITFTGENPGERRLVSDHVTSVLELANDLEAPVVVVGGGGPRSIPADMPREVGTERVLEILQRVTERGSTLGIVTALEALNRYETNIANTLEECCGYVNRLNTPWLRVVGDTFHMNIEELSLGTAIEHADARLAHLHLADNHRLAPGDGHIDFPAVLEALRKINYSGYMSFELFSINPQLWYLPTFELCDKEVFKGMEYMRRIQMTPGNVTSKPGGR